jgi:hypothetical protein
VVSHVSDPVDVSVRADTVSQGSLLQG